MSYKNIALHVNEAEHRFEIRVENNIAFIDYKKSGRKVYLIHTGVPSAIEGKGVASALVEKTLQYIDEHEEELVPLCSFVQSYLEKHPEWNRLVKKEKDD